MIGFSDRSSFYDPMFNKDNSKYRLIVLDDDPLFCSLIESIAKRKNINLFAYHEPDAFFTAIDEEKPDAVLVDFNLENELDGVDVITKLNKSFPTILISCDDPWSASTIGYKKISSYLKNNEDLQFVHKNQGPRFILSNIVRLIRQQGHSFSDETRIA